jgi:DNA-directed RNA polymerases I, II, and III subunit RPABC2|tara:strand:- start:7662 stop:8312 length:651 start_codon:yes stop_codon:yes gene_type:complete
MSSLNQEESDAENSELDEYMEEDGVKRQVVDDVDNDNSDEEEEEEDEEDLSEDEFGISSSQNIDESLLRGEMDMADEYFNEEEDEDDSDDEQYLQKFDEQLRKDIVNEYHPELIIHSNDDIQAYTRIVKNEKGIIMDPLHTTLPFVTKYERARILGERTKQLNAGAKALVEVEPEVIDGYLIALKEFEEKKIPFIVKRPMPNGGCEYWKLKDLDIL